MKNWREWFQKYVVENQIVAALLVILAGWILLTLRRVIVLLFTAYILMAAFMPLNNWLIKKRVPKLLAALIPIISVVLGIIIIIVPLSGLVLSQLQVFIQSLPEIIKSANESLPIKLISPQALSGGLDNLTNIGVNLFSFTGSVIDKVLYLFLTLFVSFYFLYDHQNIKESLFELAPSSRKNSWLSKEKEAETKFGYWVRGQLVISGSLGLLYWACYTIIGLPFAVLLAIFGAVMEIIPNIGPILAVIPALVIAVTISPVKVVSVLIVFVFIHIVEGYVIVPKVMERSVGLHPVLVTVAIFAGSILYGFWGAILAVPILSVFVPEKKTTKKIGK